MSNAAYPSGFRSSWCCISTCTYIHAACEYTWHVSTGNFRSIVGKFSTHWIINFEQVGLALREGTTRDFSSILLNFYYGWIAIALYVKVTCQGMSIKFLGTWIHCFRFWGKISWSTHLSNKLLTMSVTQMWILVYQNKAINWIFRLTKKQKISC